MTTQIDPVAIAKALGFEPEIGGGGALFLSRYWKGGAYVWVTDRGGLGLPQAHSWIVCAYPPEWDGESLQDHRTGGGLSYVEALGRAISEAESMLPDTEALAGEFDAWVNDNLPQAARDALPDGGRMSADELLAELAAMADPSNEDELRPLCAWLHDFIERWEERQAIEDFESACRARGEG